MTRHISRGASRSSGAQLRSLIIWPSRGPLNIGLNKISVFGADVNQDIAMAAGRASEMTPVIVDFRRDSRKLQSNFAITAFPHHRLPVSTKRLPLKCVRDAA